MSSRAQLDQLPHELEVSRRPAPTVPGVGHDPKPPSLRVEDELDSAQPIRTPHVVEYQVEEDTVLFDPRCNQVHTLNGTGAVVWRLCDGSRMAEEVAQDVALVFNVELPEVEGEVHRFLQPHKEEIDIRKSGA